LPANIKYSEGVLENFGEETRGKPCYVILDDLLNDVYSKQGCILFTRGRHHRNISVILITQHLFHHGRYCRDISLNAHYLVTLKKSAHQVYPEDNIGLFKAYLDANCRTHSYLILDLAQDSHDGLRYSTNIFPTEYPPVVYSDIGGDACEIQLSRLSPAQNSRTEIA